VTAATRLRRRLSGLGTVAVDTSPFIYHLEGHPRYRALTAVLFPWIESPHGAAVTSTLTMTELLVRPMRDENHSLVNAIYALGTTFPHLTWVPPSLAIAERAARVRAQHGLRTPDALQAATALVAGSGTFVTNDAAFRRVQGLDVIVLDDLLAGE
jgi:predicted nucleic acid-binding protein